MSDPAILSYYDRIPPVAIVAAAQLAGVPVDPAADPAATKDFVPKLKLPSGCAKHRHTRI